MADTNNNLTTSRWRVAVLMAWVLGSLAAIFLLAPIPQDLAYHGFGDDRTLFGMPNFFNVASNAPFVVVGLLGIGLSLRVCPPGTTSAWLTFFIAIAGVGLGSAWYHWHPDNQTLFWDRLPMTLGFMALFTILIGEYFDRRLVSRLLFPAVLLGTSSVIYWHWTDDLRFYAWVQFMPLGVIALLLVLYPGRFQQRKLLGVALVLYVLAKVLEHFDDVIFQTSGNLFSGHSLKHLSAAGGCLVILIILRRMTRESGVVSDRHNNA